MEEEKEKNHSEYTAKERKKERLKDLKIPEDVKDVLKAAKEPGETFGETIERLLDVNLKYERANMASLNPDVAKEKANVASETPGQDKKSTITNIPFDVREIGKEAEGLLSEFGLKVRDIYDYLRENQKIERIKLRRIQGKPLDLTRTIKTIVWAIVTIICLYLTLPTTSELLRWIIR